MVSIIRRHCVFSILLGMLLVIASGCGSNVSTDIPAPTIADEPGPFQVGKYSLSFTNEEGEYDADIYYPTDEQGNADYSQGPYPIFAYSPGLASVKEFQTWIGDHATTHGYIVIVFTVPSPLRLNPDQQAAGLITALDFVANESNDPSSPIFGMADASKRIIGGHSMGAMGSLQAAAVLPDLAAVIPMAPISYSVEALNGITAPIQIQGATLDCITQPEGATESYENLPAGITKQVVMIEGANHVGFATDGSLAVVMGQLLADCNRTIEVQDHQLRLSRRYMTAWMEYHVKGREAFRTFIYGGQAASDVSNGYLDSLLSENE